jgi:hypothetical protein
MDALSLPPISWAGYSEITLSRRVELHGQVYLPGLRHVVDADMLAALQTLGDEVVVNVRPAG